MVFHIRLSCAAFVTCFLLSQAVSAQGSAGYPGVYDTDQVLQLNLLMEAEDFTTIQNDLTFDIEVPAVFWADGDPCLRTPQVGYFAQREGQLQGRHQRVCRSEVEQAEKAESRERRRSGRGL